MKHLTRDDVAIAQLLQRARTIAVIGASPRRERHSHEVCRYLHEQGYEVIPVRPDRADVASMKSYARLADVAGPIDLVVIFRRGQAVPGHIAETADRAIAAAWLPPGAWTRACDEAAARAAVTLVRDACIMEEHRHLSRAGGHPRKLGVHVRRRKAAYEDQRKHPEERGYVAGGGGGSRGGGGVRATLDEKKMVGGKPSPRRGIAKRLQAPTLRGRHGRR
jgi:predicted CoA-binding protein